MSISKEAAASVLNQIMDSAVNEFNSNQRISPFVGLVGLMDDGACRIGILNGGESFFQNGEDGKRGLSQFVRMVMNQENAPHAVLICYEAWVSIIPSDASGFAGKPSKDPDHRDAIVCSLITRDNNYVHMLLVDSLTQRVTFEPFDSAQQKPWNRFAPTDQSGEEDFEAPSAPTYH